MRVLVTGASGMLGSDVVKEARARGFDVVATDREELDITNNKSVQEVVSRIAPDVIVNCAAYNFVDKVEEPEVYPVAFAINAVGPRNLAEAAKDIGAAFVHFSTDYVFPGEKQEGYNEEDPTRPLSKYGQTKEAGEIMVQKVGGRVFVCRLSKIFGAPGKGEGSKESFVALMLRLAKEKDALNVVDEEVGTPSYTPDIARAVFELLGGPYEPGIYHLVNAGGGVTWYGFVQEIFAIARVTTPVHPVESSAFPKPATRPAFAELKSTKFPYMRSRTEALRAFLSGQA